MFVLGIDPGVSRCGYACVQATKSGPHAVAIGVIRTAKDDPLAVRLAELQAELRGIFDEYGPEVLAIERVLFQKNVRTAMSVGQASGVALAEAATRGMEVVEYSPNEVKLAVAGHGGADKDQMQRMVKTLLGLSTVPKPADAADAAGLALCHLAHRGLQRRIGASASAGKPAETAPTRAGPDDRLAARHAHRPVARRRGRRRGPRHRPRLPDRDGSDRGGDDRTGRRRGVRVDPSPHP